MAKTAALLAASALSPLLDRPVGLQCREDPSIASIARAFEEFKGANDARLKEIEKRGGADVLLTEKTDKINAAIADLQKRLEEKNAELAKRADEIEALAKRGGAPKDDPAETPEARQYRADFLKYVRRGDVPEALEKRAMAVADNTQGGYLAPETVDREIAKVARTSSPVRQIARTITVSNGSYKKLVSLSNNSSGWVGEQDARPQTNPTDLRQVDFGVGEIYANVYATQNLLDDAYLNLEAWIAEETNLEFDKQEGAAFVIGDGNNKPHGLIPPTGLRVLEAGSGTVAPHGKLGYVKTGSVSALQGAATEAADRLINVQTQLKSVYRANARWAMNRFTEALARKIKDDTDNYIWQPGMQAGIPSSLLGYPITILDDMPDPTDGAVIALFGDFQRYYTIIDRIGVRILRDPYSAKPYVLFYVTKRVGGGRVLTEAVKGLVTAAD